MKVYKVVLPYRNSLVSDLARGKARVRYPPGRWVKAPFWLRRKGYHLTAFRDLESALWWIKSTCHFDEEIWEAEAKGIIIQLPPILHIYMLSKGIILKVSDNWPEGTIMVKKLRLVKKIGKAADLLKEEDEFYTCKRKSDATCQLDTSN